VTLLNYVTEEMPRKDLASLRGTFVEQF